MWIILYQDHNSDKTDHDNVATTKQSHWIILSLSLAVLEKVNEIAVYEKIYDKLF